MTQDRDAACGRNAYAFIAGMAGALAIAASLNAPAWAQPPAAPGGDLPTNLRPYFLVMLVHTAGKPGAPPPSLMQQHLAYIRSHMDSGEYVLAGPLLDDGRVAGIIIAKAATLPAARAVAQADPAVRDGRLTVEVHPMMTVDLSKVKAEYGTHQP